MVSRLAMRAALILLSGCAVLGCQVGSALREGTRGASPLEVSCQVSENQEGILVRVVARNTTDKVLFFCVDPARHDIDPHVPESKEGPYRHFGGNKTLVLYWGLVKGPGTCSQISYEVAIKAIGPGKEATFSALLKSRVVECTTDGSLLPSIYDVLAYSGDQEIKDQCGLRIERVLAVVGYWQADALAALERFEDRGFPDCADGSLCKIRNHALVTDLARLPRETFAAVAQRGIAWSKSECTRFATLLDMQFEATAGPIALPRRLIFEPRGWRGELEWGP